ncbi:MAG: HD-GYP domain-containing protein (c-di-GMP phosphodiesterase class II) [Pseudohongiellaceae bacterium]|jgi:HD-GYP domain-containing protein (c-di-GMP phosphodiesterase class II)
MRHSEPKALTDTIIKLSCQEILIGMFIAEIDCSWTETPFPIGGFHIKRSEDIQMLAKYCRSVHIDTTRGAVPARLKQENLTILSSARKASPQAAGFKINRNLYRVTSNIKKQLDSSSDHYQDLLKTFAAITENVRQGEKLNFSALDSSVDALIDSAAANTQTLIWILNTDPSPIAATDYCVRAAIWATLCACHMGLPRAEIQALFVGTLLCDIGLHLLPERLVNKRVKFRKKEFLAYKKHVNFSVDLLSSHSEVDEKIMRIVRCHHERNDGLGFPKGLKGEQIPALARLAHLGYSFERLLRSLSETASVSPARAIARLYKQRDLKFPEQLIVEFIHLMGMYPLGTLVELNSGEIAIVLEQHPNEKLNPKVAILTGVDQMKVEKPFVVQLGEGDSGRSVLSSLGPKHKGVRASDYRFSFAGRRLAIGGFGIRF